MKVTAGMKAINGRKKGEDEALWEEEERKEQMKKPLAVSGFLPSPLSVS